MTKNLKYFLAKVYTGREILNPKFSSKNYPGIRELVGFICYIIVFQNGFRTYNLHFKQIRYLIGVEYCYSQLNNNIYTMYPFVHHQKDLGEVDRLS